jgi:hypothetical protein
MSNGAALPVAGHAGGTFRAYTGPVSAGGCVLFIAGLAAEEGVESASFDVLLNHEPCEPAPDHGEPSRFPGVARALQFDCPLRALKEGYNEVTITQPANQAEQQIVWAEIRIEPAR